MNDSATWKVDYWNFTGYGCFNCQYKYYLDGDTAIEGMLYKKLRVSELDVWGSNYSNSYIGAIREDLQIRKVFFYPNYPEEEFLLFDYSLNVGDTLDSYLGSDAVIFAVDSVLVGNQLHKRMMYSLGIFPDTLALIEGVGMTNGLLQSLYDNTFETTSHLTCFEVSGELMYTANEITQYQSGCDVLDPLSVSEATIQESINFFPNPAHSKINIATRGPIECVIIYNLYGTIIKNYFDVSLEIDVSDLMPGYYFMQVKASEKTIIKRLSIQ